MASAVDNHITILPAFLERFPAWKNFPAGLHVLVSDEDEAALKDAQIKLEACNYSVTVFSDNRATLAAIQDRSESFHLAIVEVNRSNAAEAFGIVRAAKHVPTILLSATKNVTLMMEGIAAGASEFMEKPLSEDKLKNLWQHVFKKALATGELVVPDEQQAVRTEDELVPHSQGADAAGGQAMAAAPHLCHSLGVRQIKEEPSGHCNMAENTSDSVPDESHAFLEDYMNEDDDQDAQNLCFCKDVEPVQKSPGPSTPQLEQAENRVINVSDDESPHSQDLIGLEDTNCCTDDCSSFVCNVKSDQMEDMEGLFQTSNSDGDEFQSLPDFDSLDAALQEGKGLQAGRLNDFQDSLILADDLVDELSSCLDMDSSILDELPSGSDHLQQSLDCMDDGDQHDEEALLLAEVAKAEAGMGNSCGYMSSTYNSRDGREGKSPARSSDSEQQSKGSKSMHSKKKMKVDWTPELHRRFVQAVEHLGVDKAIPSRILEIMGANHLTRHNIASHLQKYRSHKKHLQAREVEAATWNQRRQLDAVSRAAATQPQVVARPPPPLVPMGLHVWGHPTPDQFCWPKPWQASDSSVWHQPPLVCLDAWGHPAPGAPFFDGPPPVLRLPLAPITGAINRAMPVLMHAEKMPGFHPPKDKVDAAINEVLKNPFTPLPLGLKPPSLDSVISELQRQGIKTKP